jgi:TatD DNase family protein
MKLFDSHCHLQDLRLADRLEQVMARAAEAGVAGFFSCGSAVDNWERLIEVTERFPQVVPAFGVHPWYIHEAPLDYLTQLAAFLKKMPAVVGEIGLDFAIEDRDERLQEEVFVAQMQLARELRLPMNIHCRKAWHKLLPLLKAHWSPELAVVVHSFAGTDHVVKELVPLGCYFSFSGGVTRSGNTRVHKAIKVVPLDRLLLETDAPDIPPVIDHAINYDIPNEPANIRYVLKAAAGYTGRTEEELAACTWENAQRVLALLRTR